MMFKVGCVQAFMSNDGKFSLREMIQGEGAVQTFSLQLAFCLLLTPFWDWDDSGLMKTWGIVTTVVLPFPGGLEQWGKVNLLSQQNPQYDELAERLYCWSLWSVPGWSKVEDGGVLFFFQNHYFWSKRNIVNICALSFSTGRTIIW